MAFTDVKFLVRKYKVQIAAWRTPPLKESWESVARLVCKEEKISPERAPSASGIRYAWLALSETVNSIDSTNSCNSTNSMKNVSASPVVAEFQNPVSQVSAPQNAPVSSETSVDSTNSCNSTNSMKNSPLIHAPTPNLPEGIPDPLSIITLTGSEAQQKADADFMRKTMALYGHRLAD